MTSLNHILNGLRALYRSERPNKSQAAAPIEPSRPYYRGHRPRTKQELRHALQQLKAIRSVRGERVEGSVQPKRAA